MVVTGSWSTQAVGCAVLVHGGAGARAGGTTQAVQGCAAAADAAFARLRAGESALNAVQCAVEVLEDDPLFNAGTGGALTSDGTLELDASLMEGGTLRAGAVCCLPPYQNPIAVARAVLEESRHVLYAGQGADGFARGAGFSPVAPERMITAQARAKLARHLARSREVPALDPGGDTVGAVALDRDGHVAAATSTGGMLGQRPGRVGDSPLIGAGTYADDLAGAASATGLGESIMRIGLCLYAVTQLQGSQPAEAVVSSALERLSSRAQGSGGLIVLTPRGELALARSTPHMPWAARWSDGGAEGA